MFILPNLPYDYSALEPFIDTETMHIHHDKHHAAYVKNLNDILVGHDDFLNMDVVNLLNSFDKVPEDIKQKVINNAGGVANHNIFWNIMSPNADGSERKPQGNLASMITSSFSSFDKFKEVFTNSALGHFGSGWAWLVKDVGNGGSLRIITTSNQDNPTTHNTQPILALDVWEHAYYLKYKNMRADYINAWWSVVNWKEVENLYDGI